MRRPAALALVLLLAFAASYAVAGRANFGGIDEWPLLHLASKGIVSFPYAHRPLALLWILPAHVPGVSGLGAYYWLAAAYIALTGLLVFAICRRLAPGEDALAFYAGAFAMLWAPRDPMRLSTVQGTVHLGFAFGAVLAVALLVESWARRSRALLLTAAVVALATSRSYEPVLPLVGGALLLLPWRSRECRSWTVAWGATIALGAVLAVWTPAGAGHAYQASIGLDLRPLAIAERFLDHYRLHLAPLFSGYPPPAVTGLVSGVLVLAAGLTTAPGASPRASVIRLGAAGLVGAALAYFPYTLTAGISGATRTQMLSSPPIAILLGASLALLGRVGRTSGRVLAAVLAALVVFIGGSQMAGIQRVWDRHGFYPAQRDMLSALVRVVPDVPPHTLVLLVGDTARVWPMNFTFRHAVSLLYDDRAKGMIPGIDQGTYPSRMEAGGIEITPWPSIQTTWGEPATVYRYDEVIVVEMAPQGSLRLVESWPAGLAGGEGYDPLRRRRPEAAPIPGRAALSTK